MRRRGTRSSGLVGQCATAALLAATLVVSIVSSAPAAPPRYLQPPATQSGSPFDAALTHGNAPRQYDSYRYLGRPSLQPTPPPVTHAAEPPHSQWGHSQIEQTQYPLVEPPADRAADEPQRLMHPQQINNADCEPWIAIKDIRTDITSLLGSGDQLGITTIGIRGSIESPRFQGFSIRPIFGLHALAGPVITDLPGQLYDISVEARMYIPFGDRWLGEFAVAPGIFTDFDNTSSDALRIVGRGIGYYKWSDQLRLAIGVAYLDREDIALLPLGGVIWTPNEDWRYEITLPRPRIAHRYGVENDDERWIYLAGEFGGGSWAIQRAGGAADIATYRDYRLLLGVEFTSETGPAWLLEAGYAFGRQLEYQSGLGDYEPEATAVLRAALTF